MFALFFKYDIDPRWSSVSGLTLLLTASDMDPACSSFSDSLWLICSVWSPLMNCDGAISMSECLHGTAWYGLVSRSTTAVLLSAM